MLEGKLGDTKPKLAQAKSMVSTRDKELTDLNEAMKQSEEIFYNMGFIDAENSLGLVVFEAWRLGSNQGWMAAVDALNLPTTSPFKDPTQITLPNDLPV